PMGRSSTRGMGSAGRRVKPSTAWPRSANPRHSARPMKPAAPVTTMRDTHHPEYLHPAPDWASGFRTNPLKTRLSRSNADPSRVALPKLLFLVTEDWYFCSHRLPVARAARADGYSVVVATRVQAHGAQIQDEGFALRPIAWRRRGDGLLGAARAISAIIRLYRAERPDIVHHIALKPILFGGLARRLAFARSTDRP